MATILIVDDEVFIRESAGWMAEDLGHTPLLAGDLTEALSHIGAVQAIDLLFVDIRLSDLAQGGYDVANQAISHRPGLPVLYTSGRPLTPAMTEQFIAGGQFLQKPYSPEQFESSVTKLLQ